MDFNFDLSSLFPRSTLHNDVVKLGQDLLPVDLPRHTVPMRHMPLMQQRIAHVVDRLGEASAAAQSLKAPITSADKLQAHPEHSLYLLIDRNAKEDRTCAVGMLKVGHKNLFLVDGTGEQHETLAACVLDFYVHESRQRTGCGHRLYAHMLSDRGVLEAAHLAIDRPSPKLVAFLAKYYGLERQIPQVNNYVIYEGFFSCENSCTQGNSGLKRPRIYMGKLQYV